MNKFYDAEIDECIAGEEPKTLMVEGDWKLYDFNKEGEYDTSSLWHKCPKGIQNNAAHEGIWPVRYMDYIDTGNLVIEHEPHAWKCVYCYEIPPDKILTLFLLHNFDRLAK
jgi:hypothetical protein